jgi:Domain of unknown function (DUF6916)
MGSSRRDFLKKGSLVALAAGVPMSLAEKALGSETASSSAENGLTKAAFMAHLNTDFLINVGAARVSVRLVEVSDLPGGGTTTRKEAFSLLFRGDRATALKQSTYLIEHRELGLFSFLIVPVMSRENAAPRYEAIINRRHP